MRIWINSVALDAIPFLCNHDLALQRFLFYNTGNGVVDFGEFVNMMINQNNNTLDQEELLEAFRTFDGDDKGYIFSNEIRYVMRHMGESIPEQDINEILQDHQESRKRKITFEGT